MSHIVMLVVGLGIAILGLIILSPPKEGPYLVFLKLPIGLILLALGGMVALCALPVVLFYIAVWIFRVVFALAFILWLVSTIRYAVKNHNRDKDQ